MIIDTNSFNLNWNKINFLKMINSVHKFPCNYMFKFIVPISEKDKLLKFFKNDDYKLKESSSKNFISITLSKMMKNANEIIYIYEKTSKIKNIILL